jgi:hypothetical protein
MKKTFSISVKEPCSENFINFKKTKNGGYCNSCQKEVIDFTKLSNTELVKYLKKDERSTCGLFKSSQLKTHQLNSVSAMKSKIFARSLGLASFSLLAMCAIPNVQAQETASVEQIAKTKINVTPISMNNTKSGIEKYTVSGTVLDEQNIPLAGVNVILKGTKKGVVTDYDGKFKFPETLAINDVLLFSYIGYETKEYKVTKSASETIDITINFESADVELMGEVLIMGGYKTKRNIFQKFIGLFK